MKKSLPILKKCKQVLPLSSNTPPLLFLHGFMGSPKDWDPFIFPNFSKRCITIPGHEFSPLPHQKPLLRELLKIIYKQFNKKKSILIGYSLGGRLAMHFACAFPELIDSLIILSANPGLECSQQRAIRRKKDEKWADFLLNYGLSSFLKKWQEQSLFNALPPLSFKRREHHCPNALSRILRELSPGRLPSLWSRLPHFSFETLYLFGENDIDYKKIAKKMEGSIAVDMIPKAKHAIHLENPSACIERINQFIKYR